jgi:hypothetical protein
MKGIVTAIDRKHLCGVILGEDRNPHPFERENMVRWLQFDELSLGMSVLFDVELNGRAFNVERRLLNP